MKDRKLIATVLIVSAVIGAAAGVYTYKHHQKVLREEREARLKQLAVEKEIKEASDNIIVAIKGDENTVLKQGEEYIESGAYGMDKLQGPITTYETKGRVNKDKPGDYKIEYIFKSGKGKKTLTRNVKVVLESEFVPNTKGISVLAYHGVCKDNDTEAIQSRFEVTESALIRQLQYLKDNHYYFPSHKELRAYIDGVHSLPEKSVLVTFDDGRQDFLDNGIPILEKLQVPATSFMIGTMSNARENIKKYASRYVICENHTYDLHGNHVNGKAPLELATKEQIRQDFAANSQILGSNDAMAYPYGAYTPDAQDVIREQGITCAYKFKPGKVVPGSDFTCLPRMEIRNKFTINDFIFSLQ